MRAAIGSNAWAAGAARSADGDALLANDPHLDVTIPGIWYLVDLQSPQVHVAGATIPGIPGVVLGHNERLAWAATNAAMATKSIFEAGRLREVSWVTERFHVRFSHDVRVAYYRTARDFSIPDENDPSRFALVRWPVYAQTPRRSRRRSTLDRARSVGEALTFSRNIAARRRTSCSPIAAAAVAYHVAGLVPDDPAWGRYVHRARDLRNAYPPIPFAQLPATAPSRSAVLLSANNKAYAPGYRYRLSAQFEPPYRAYRIAQLLHARIALRRSLLRAHAARHALAARSRDCTRRRALGAHACRDAEAKRVRHCSARARGTAATRRTRARPRSNTTCATISRAHDLLARAAERSRFRAARQRAWADVGGMRIEHVLAPMHFTLPRRRVAARARATSTRFTCKSPASRRGFAPSGIRATGIAAASPFPAASRASPGRATTPISRPTGYAGNLRRCLLALRR